MSVHTHMGCIGRGLLQQQVPVAVTPTLVLRVDVRALKVDKESFFGDADKSCPDIAASYLWQLSLLI